MLNSSIDAEVNYIMGMAYHSAKRAARSHPEQNPESFGISRLRMSVPKMVEMLVSVFLSIRMRTVGKTCHHLPRIRHGKPRPGTRRRRKDPQGFRL